ncbi:MAG: histidine kinase [Flavobacteriaceae bacterium]|jgi:hypothetical protein|nr:histidine kinase [Flavobacteriaceae bacterium]
MNTLKTILILTIFPFWGTGGFIFAQDSTILKSQQTAVSKLEKAVSSRDLKNQAEAYISIADNYFNQKQYSKSEENLLKAKQIYEQINNKKGLAEVARKLAQAQENQNKWQAAAENYETAENYSGSALDKSRNQNDYKRLTSNSPAAKQKAIEENISINSQKSENYQELAKDYTNLADVNIQQKNIPLAVQNLNSAYEITKNSMPQQALEINRKKTDLYVENKEFEKAIESKKQVLEEDFVKKNSEVEVKQIQELADIYLKTDDSGEAEKLLESAYKIAIEKGHTLEARKSILKLDSLYVAKGEIRKSIGIYKDFLSKLPNLLSKDQSLTDSKLMQETEEKINQLEKEKNLQEQIVKKKNLLNYFLFSGLILAVIFIGYALFTQRKLRIQNKKIELQSLRREMNPHFIFNSLNSVNQFIAENNELEANQYLTKFSKLMRGVMENSKEDFIGFSEELELLQNYLALEKIRFNDKFDYEINVAENLKNSDVQIPGMLIQPFLENSIWHGLRYRNEKGFLQLNFKKDEKKLTVEIDDNGIGIEKSKAQKTVHQNRRNGRGMKNIQERIQLLNSLYGKNITVSVSDKPDENGVLVVLEIV